MATTSPDNIYSPDPNTLYNFVTDLRNMAVSVQAALSRRVSALRGTTAEMNAALSSAPQESTWYNTTTNLWYTKSATSWVESGPNSFRGPNAAMNSYPNPKVGMTWWDTGSNISWNRTSTGWVIADTGWYQVGVANQPFAVTYRAGIGAYTGSPWSGMRWRVKDGVFYMGGAISKTTNIATGEPVIDIPASLRPPGSMGGAGLQYYATVNAVVSNSAAGQAVSGYITWPV